MSLSTRTLGGYPVNKHSSALRRSGLDLKHDALPICLCRRITGLHDIILRPESLDRSSTHRAGAPAKAISMLFNIEADWTLNLLCNYDYTYCFSRASTEHRLIGRMSPEQYLDFFDSTGRVWLLHLTGGEPFFHPSFVHLCRTLTCAALDLPHFQPLLSSCARFCIGYRRMARPIY